MLIIVSCLCRICILILKFFFPCILKVIFGDYLLILENCSKCHSFCGNLFIFKSVKSSSSKMKSLWSVVTRYTFLQTYICDSHLNCDLNKGCLFKRKLPLVIFLPSELSHRYECLAF